MITKHAFLLLIYYCKIGLPLDFFVMEKSKKFNFPEDVTLAFEWYLQRS